MKEIKNIETIVEETLESLRGIRRASPGDHFYTRLLGRLQPRENGLWEQLISFIARPVVAFSVFLAVVLANGLVIFDNAQKAGITASKPELTITEEYNQDFVAFYDPENIAP